jgi:peptide/nickel transport system ATP-binding protein
MRSDTLLSVEGLCVAAEVGGASRVILDDVSFSMQPREALGVIGRSGSGKSVLAKSLVGWLDPPLTLTGGAVRFGGADLVRADARSLRAMRGRRIGYVGADPTTVFDPTIPIGSQIAEKLMAVRSEIGRKEAMDRVVGLFEAVKIPDARLRAGELPSKFSGGMIQRAAIVDAMIADTELLIADNVTQPLDVTVAAQIIRLFQDLRKDLNTAILFISSSLPVVRDIADRLLVLEEGRVVERATPDNLAAHPETSYSKALIAQIPRIWSEGAAPAQAHPDAVTVLRVADVKRTYRVRDRRSLFGSFFVQAVRGVSFEVKAGESLGIVGESGCGKSTLLRLLTWLEMPDSGAIAFDGVDLGAMSRRERFALRARLQLVLQDPYGSIPAHWTVGRIISEPLRLHCPLSAPERKVRVVEAMTEVGLDATLYAKLPGGLSAGQRQRINLARALVLEPKVLLLDETLSALDQTEQTRLITLFEQIQRKRGITYIFISHDLAMVRRVCSRVAVMYLGKIVELAGNQQLFFSPHHPYTRALLSAAPTLDVSPYARGEYLKEGEPPSPVCLPPGCSFANRCPKAMPICREQEPQSRLLPDGGIAACHFAGAADAA